MRRPGKKLEDCEGECEVDTGQRIGADYVVTGQVAKFGQVFNITLRLHSTQSARLLSSTQFSASRLEALPQALPKPARELFAPLLASTEAEERQAVRVEPDNSKPGKFSLLKMVEDMKKGGGAERTRKKVLADVNVEQGHAERNCPAGMAFISKGTMRRTSEMQQATQQARPPNVRAHRRGEPIKMGGGGGADDTLNIDEFCMDLTEVTVEKYTECVKDAKCTPAASGLKESEATGSASEAKLWPDYGCNGSRLDRLDHPINCVDWFQADAYCKAVGKRLPTDVEWQWAAQGEGAGYTYPWGNEPPNGGLLNACGQECVAALREKGRPMRQLYADSDGWVGTAPVGSFTRGKTKSGLFDMAGNVWEWTSSGPNPEKPNRILKGGSWQSDSITPLRVATTASTAPNGRDADAGFRCVKTVGE